MTVYARFFESTMLHELRHTEFSRLDESRHVYLDYTGSALYPESLVRSHSELLARGVFGNPHSHSPASAAATDLVERVRQHTLRFFRADPDEYAVVFTSNATAALKLVGEAYPFEPGSRLLLTADNHNSVLGMREFARVRGADVRYVPLDTELRATGLDASLAGADPRCRNLFVFPAQSNFSGVRHPLEWIDYARRCGYDVALDAAAYVPTRQLDLSEHQPDFVCVSFYKMFGFPTGVGALIARRAALQRLRSPWFAGGTVRFSSMQNPVHIRYQGAAALEEGTPNFLGIAAVEAGLHFLERAGMDAITRHVGIYTRRLLDSLRALRHPDDQPAVRIYGPATMSNRGGTIAFNLLDTNGHPLDCTQVERHARDAGISLRTGRFCNPGASEFAFEYPTRRAHECYRALEGDSFTLKQFSICLGGQPIGAVRVSVGIPTDDHDVERFLEVIASCITPQPLVSPI